MHFYILDLTRNVCRQTPTKICPLTQVVDARLTATSRFSPIRSSPVAFFDQENAVEAKFYLNSKKLPS